MIAYFVAIGYLRVRVDQDHLLDTEGLIVDLQHVSVAASLVEKKKGYLTRELAVPAQRLPIVLRDDLEHRLRLGRKPRWCFSLAVLQIGTALTPPFLALHEQGE